jgi:hypothetical protein
MSGAGRVGTGAAMPGTGGAAAHCFQMDKDDPQLMADRKKRIKRIGALDARLRAYFSELSAMAPPRDYDNLLARAFSGQERYRPEPISENELGGGRTDEV